MHYTLCTSVCVCLHEWCVCVCVCVLIVNDIKDIESGKLLFFALNMSLELKLQVCVCVCFSIFSWKDSRTGYALTKCISFLVGQLSHCSANTTQ